MFSLMNILTNDWRHILMYIKCPHVSRYDTNSLHWSCMQTLCIKWRENSQHMNCMISTDSRLYVSLIICTEVCCTTICIRMLKPGVWSLEFKKQCIVLGKSNIKYNPTWYLDKHDIQTANEVELLSVSMDSSG